MKALKYVACILFLYSNLLIAQSISWDKIENLFGGKLYSLMKDSNNFIYAGTFKGVFKLTNDSNYWENISTQKLSVDGLTYVNQNYFLCSYWTTIMISTNQGNSWDSLFSSPYGSVISSIYRNNNDIYAGTSDLTFMFTSDFGSNWEITNLNGIFPPYSYDFISTFELINDSLLFVGSDGSGLFIVNRGSSNVSVISNLPKSIFDFEQSDSNKIYCGTSNGIYISTDIGQNWTLAGIEGRKIYSLKRNNNYFFAGTDSGMYISTNNGLFWELKSFDNIHPTINDILLIDSERLCVATSFGFYITSNNGSTWNQNNYGINAIGGIYDIETINDSIFLATSNGFYASTDNGYSWLRKGAGLSQEIIASIASDKSSNIYAGTNVGIFKSTNYGRNWNFILSGTFLRNIASYNDVVFGAKSWNSQGTGIYRSSDQGLSWQIISDIEGTINTFCLLPNNYIMAGGDNLYISSDIGLSWNQLQSPVWGGGEITELKSNDSSIYMSSDIAGLYISNDIGNNWLSLGLESLLISAIEVYHDSIFVGINNAINNPDPDGPFLSTNRGITWSTINQGLDNPSVLSFCFDSRGYLLAGTWDDIYITSEVIATSIKNKTTELPNKFTLFQNFPNPFNPVTSIQYAVSSRQFVTLKVYDVLGNEIATLVNEEKQPGIYEVEFSIHSDLPSGEGRNLTSGIYFYQLLVSALQSKDGKAGDYTQTRKMILLK